MTWLEVNLSEVADVQWGNTSITKASYVDKGFPAFSATGNDGYVEHAEHNVDGIVLSAIGARCGKCFLASGKWTAIKNTITIVPNPSKIHLKYLYVILNDEKSWLTKGAAQPFITLGIARNRKIPLPPLAEQKRIAALLDTADNIMRLREQAIAKLDELAQSIFVDMFDELISSSSKTVNDFFEVNVNRYETNLKDTDDVAFVPMSAVSEISKSIENEEIRTYSEVKKGYTPIKRGDLIVAKITPCYENGKQAIANVSTQFAYGSTEFHTFRSSNKDLVTLLYYYLQTYNVKREGAANMKGAAGQRRVPDSFFKSLPFVQPNASDLNKFGAFIGMQKKSRAEQVKQLEVIRNTIKSLQHQSFAVN